MSTHLRNRGFHQRSRPDCRTPGRPGAGAL